MNDFLLLMSRPFLACVVLTGIHAYLGLHVIARRVIFVDLALAQMAALGSVLAVLSGFELESISSYGFSLAATFSGALLLSLLRSRTEKIPQEAVVGIVYAVSAAAAILLLSRSAEGDEHIRRMLVGNILVVRFEDILKMGLLYVMIGLLHWLFRKEFILVSADPDAARRQKLSIRFWDFIFYATFALVVTSSVRVAGVLLVFSFLIIPPAIAILFAEKWTSRLKIGWVVGTAVSLAGIAGSYFLDLPTGAAVVCAFGAALVCAAAIKTSF